MNDRLPQVGKRLLVPVWLGGVAVYVVLQLLMLLVGMVFVVVISTSGAARLRLRSGAGGQRVEPRIKGASRRTI